MSEKEHFNFNEWFAKNRGWILYTIVSSVVFVTTSLQMNCRQNQIENRVITSEQNAIHKTETAFALGISGLKQTATVLENAMIEQRTQNILIIEHCKKTNCKLPTELTVIKDLPKYTPIAETYFGVQQIMIEKSKEN